MRQLEERVVGGQEDDGEAGGGVHAPVVRDGKRLVLGDGDARRIAVEAREGDDTIADRARGDAGADLVDSPRDLEAGRDRPADVLLRRRVEAHAHDAVGVIDADRLDRDAHVVVPAVGICGLLELESFPATGLVDAYALHAAAS